MVNTIHGIPESRNLISPNQSLHKKGLPLIMIKSWQLDSSGAIHWMHCLNREPF